jgi:hypothetical protein
MALAKTDSALGASAFIGGLIIFSSRHGMTVSRKSA